MSPRRAVVVLATSGYPNRLRDLDAFLAEADRPSELRALAAEWLGRIEHPDAAAALLRRLDTSDARVRRHVVRRRPPCPGADAVDPLLSLAERESGAARDRARFAAGLIAHRLERPSSPIYLPEDIPAVDIGDAAAVRVVRPMRRDVEACVMDLAAESCGVAFDESSALEVRIDAERWTVLPDVRAARPRGDRAILWGALAEWDAVRGDHGLAGVILSSPATAGSPRLHLHDLDGDLLAVVDAPCADNRGALSLRTVTDAVGLAFAFEGGIRQGRLEIDAARAALIESRKHVAAELPPKAALPRT